MRFVLVLLLALPAASDEVELHLDKEMPVERFLEWVAGELDWTVLCDPNLPIRGQKLGVGINGNVVRIPRHRLADSYRAILAFYEVHLVDVGGGVQVATRWSHGFFKWRPEPVRRDLTVVGLGTTLEFDVTAPANLLKGVTLPPRTRDRLLLALRFGLHPHGRATAARLLGALRPHFKQTADALVRALDDEDETVRFAAVVALGEMGAVAHHTRPRLCALLKDPKLRLAADRALQLTRTRDD